MEHELTCIERFQEIIKVIRVIAKMCGCDILNPNYRMNFITWLLIVGVNGFFLCTIYTIYKGMAIDHDWTVIPVCLCIIGSGIQGFAKILLVLKYRKVIVVQQYFLENVYTVYQQKTERYRHVLNRWLAYTVKTYKLCAFMYVFVGSIIIGFPYIYWYIYGIRMMIMQFEIPFVDPNTDVGYIIHTLYHFPMIAWGCLGHFMTDIYMFMFIINVPLLKDLLEQKFLDLNEVLEETNEREKVFPLLKDIFQWHLQYNEFIAGVDKIYRTIIFIEVTTCGLSICCTIFSIVLGVWPAAYGYIIYLIFCLYSFCIMGTLIEISNDNAIDIIYTVSHWYELKVPEQKMILIMLSKSQKPIELTVGQILPLSVSTALKVTKGVYSFLMLLLNFLDK
ncbi:odorant receptor 67d-like [Glossina fuscipes fuscipes]